MLTKIIMADIDVSARKFLQLILIKARLEQLLAKHFNGDGNNPSEIIGVFHFDTIVNRVAG